MHQPGKQEGSFFNESRVIWRSKADHNTVGAVIHELFMEKNHFPGAAPFFPGAALSSLCGLRDDDHLF